MPHDEHKVIDGDKVFLIDPTSRSIISQSSKKKTLVQGDHNSERYTFVLPKEIESHDMSLCNKVRVHFMNVGAEGSSPGVHEIQAEDIKVLEEKLEIEDEDGNVTEVDGVTCSWLISGHATKFAGALGFLLEYLCTSPAVNEKGETVDNIDYAWHTLPYNEISVAAGMNCSSDYTTLYADVLSEWYYRFVAAEDSALTNIGNYVENDAKPNIDAYVEEQKTSIVENVASDFKPVRYIEQTLFPEEQAQARANIGVDNKSILTINDRTLKFWVGTTEEYGLLTEEEKAGLFAIVTDDSTKQDLLDLINEKAPLINPVFPQEMWFYNPESEGGYITGGRIIRIANGLDSDSGMNFISLEDYTKPSECARANLKLFHAESLEDKNRIKIGFTKPVEMDDGSVTHQLGWYSLYGDHYLPAAKPDKAGGIRSGTAGRSDAIEYITVDESDGYMQVKMADNATHADNASNAVNATNAVSADSANVLSSTYRSYALIDTSSVNVTLDANSVYLVTFMTTTAPIYQTAMLLCIQELSIETLSSLAPHPGYPNGVCCSYLKSELTLKSRSASGTTYETVSPTNGVFSVTKLSTITSA